MYGDEANSLEKQFPQELELLSGVFGDEDVWAHLKWMNTVSAFTETKWAEYVEAILRKTINYLLIAEAPPGTADNPPLYFLDPACRPRTLMKAVSSAFFDTGSVDGKKTLAKLADQGFLMVDSIPFAMDYTARRARPSYAKLVAMTADTYMRAKLASSQLSWSDKLKIAFSVPLNARCVMTGLQNTLQLGHRRFPLTQEMIATNASNYPDGNLLRELFSL
jgi:hypothetical protein